MEYVIFWDNQKLFFGGKSFYHNLLMAIDDLSRYGGGVIFNKYGQVVAGEEDLCT